MRDPVRTFGLDFMRAAAIVFVVLAHGQGLLKPFPHSYRLEYFFFDGVTLFFALSGFLIGRILIRTVLDEQATARTLLDFWSRRWWRTLPNYFLVLAMAVGASYFLSQPLPTTLFSYVFFVQNLAWPHPAFFSEAWSLATEEWFYLSIPILLFGCARHWPHRRRQVVLAFIVIVIVAVTALRLLHVVHVPNLTPREWDEGIRKVVVMRLDGLMMGVAAAYVSMFFHTQWTRYKTIACVSGLAVLVIDKLLSNNPMYMATLKLSVCSIGATLLLPAMSQWHRKNDLLTKLVTFVSVASYAMYLLNLTLVHNTGLVLYRTYCSGCSNDPMALYALYWGATIGGAALIHYGFERHMTPLRDRFAIRKPAVKEIEQARPVAYPHGSTVATDTEDRVGTV